MQKKFNITAELEVTFDVWIAKTPSKTLLINAHGMQDAAMLEVNTSASPLLPKSNYAFTVPWDRALFNPFFKNYEDNLPRFMNAFKERANEFSMHAPRLAIYPFFDDVTWPPVFEQFALHDSCDIAHFCDISIGHDYIMFDQLLRQPHWEGGTIGEHYCSILLITCRSDLARGIGMGGAPPITPNGLYKANGRDPHITMI